MAENTETRVIKLEIDQTQALKDLEKTESALIDLKNQQKELNDSLKAGTITQQEYVASKVQLDQKIQQETANRKTLTQTINTESNSLAAQKLKLKELIAERDKIDRSTTEGSKKFDEMNKSILNLNGSIKKAEEQGGSFQRNVGNYKGTIDQFTGGAYSAAEGLGKMTLQALKFIATPIGAIIAAVAVAIGSLIAYFKGSEEGQNKMNKIMAIGSAVMEMFMDVVEDLGEVVFTVFEKAVGIVGKFASFLGIIPAGVEAQIKATVDAGSRLADMRAKLAKVERETLVDNAKKALEVSELRRKADESEGKNKLNFLNQALALEKEMIDQEVANAELRHEAAVLQMAIEGETTEALKLVAETEAAVFQARQKQFDETRKMNKERIATEKDIQKERDAIIAAELKQEQEFAKTRDSLWVEDQKRRKKTLDDEKEQAAAEAKHAKDVMTATEEILAAKVEASKKATKAANDAEEEERQERIKTLLLAVSLGQQLASSLSGIFAGITATRNMESKNQLDQFKLQQEAELKELKTKFDRGLLTEEEYKAGVEQINKDFAKKTDDIKRKAFEDNKKNQIAQARIDQAQIILGAIKSMIGVPLIGAILAAAAAAAQLVITEIQIDKIKASQYVPGSFSIGGYTGPGGVHDPAGVVHKGEVVWNQRDVAAVGGPMAANAMRPTFGLSPYAEGGIVASALTSQIDQQFMSAGQFPPVQLSLNELNQAQNALAQKVQIVEA